MSAAPPDPVWLAALHLRSFTMPRPWTAAEFALMLDSPRHLVLTLPGAALAVVQVVADEAELLTIAVDPALRRQHLGARLLLEAQSAAAVRGAQRMFLDVAADNVAAIALYTRGGFALTGRRKGYYRQGGVAVDALLMECSPLPPGAASR